MSETNAEDVEYLASVGIEIIDDEEVVEAEIEEDFSDVPQGKPEGMRVGGDAERELKTCTTCGGAGSYPVEVFTEADDEGVRHVKKIPQGCATCNGTGRELMLS